VITLVTKNLHVVAVVRHQRKLFQHHNIFIKKDVMQLKMN